MAVHLARSLAITNPDIRRAIVTDRLEDPALNRIFHHLVPMNPKFGSGLRQKLHLVDYSPFEETMFIDSDCLVISDIADLWSSLKAYSFTTFGNYLSEGDWYMDVKQMCQRFNLERIPAFNGGFYYFRKDRYTEMLQRTCLALADRYDVLGFYRFRDGINEEPIVGLSMAMHKMAVVDDHGNGLRTPVDSKGPFRIDTLSGQCSFVKRDEYVTPRIVHFCGSYADHFHYRRETIKISIYRLMSSLPPRLVSASVNGLFNPPYAIVVFFRRLVKQVIRKQKFNYADMLPIFYSE
jgi:hypothetical protein